MRKTILMALLAVMSGSASAEWVLTSFTSDGSVVVYADLATIHKVGNFVKMWHLFDYKTAQHADADESFLSLKGQDEFDCKKVQVRTLALVAYPERMGKGTPVSSLNTPDEWKQVAPESAIDNLWKVACGKK